MSVEINMAGARQMIERAFNNGDLGAVDELLLHSAVDHQEPAHTDFPSHLKRAVTMLRTAFPDLHFEIHHMLAGGDMVAFHSTMTGTHLGPFQGQSPTGRAISVRHMHFLRMVNGKGADLWHLWDTPALMKQIGAVPGSQPVRD
ncbi:ester cyclase [Deinococcus sp.]|uniref:ester cyclase n=1 Tax=Deinococcus sp. TaxID=47478 RepID=UPI00286E9CB9|nr:ester cyclase [Deinococcus sp.]